MEHTELLEVLFVEMDPLEDCFSRALVEVHRDGDRYVLLEIAPPLPATGCSGSPPKTRSQSTRPSAENAVDLSNETALAIQSAATPPLIGAERIKAGCA
jgi:hypothetical protein